MSHDILLARRPVPGGSGVFALQSFEPGRHLLDFDGPLIDRAGLDAALSRGDVDVYLQISSDRYMGPSGGLDDFVNHSCEPNCGLQFSSNRIVLTAICAIAVDEELSFDYASTQNAYPHRFSCGCGSPICRGEIGDFDDLPDSLKRAYHERGILAPFLAAKLAGDNSMRIEVRMGP